MAKYYNIKLTSGTSNGPYTIYYNSVSAGNVATIVSSGTPASGLTYNNVYPNGVNVLPVPVGAIYNINLAHDNLLMVIISF